MSLILAIEPDREQADQIAGIVRGRLHGELVVADAGAAAVRALRDRIPDLILTPALLPPKDEMVLTGWLRELGQAAAHVQTLAVPILRSERAVQRESGSGIFGRRRTQAEPGRPHGCDPAVFAEQMQLYLQRAAQERAARDAARPNAERNANTYEEPAAQPVAQWAGSTVDVAAAAHSEVYAEPEVDVDASYAYESAVPVEDACDVETAGVTSGRIDDYESVIRQDAVSEVEPEAPAYAAYEDAPAAEEPIAAAQEEIAARSEEMAPEEVAAVPEYVADAREQDARADASNEPADALTDVEPSYEVDPLALPLVASQFVDGVPVIDSSLLVDSSPLAAFDPLPEIERLADFDSIPGLEEFSNVDLLAALNSVPPASAMADTTPIVLDSYLDEEAASWDPQLPVSAPEVASAPRVVVAQPEAAAQPAASVDETDEWVPLALDDVESDVPHSPAKLTRSALSGSSAAATVIPRPADSPEPEAAVLHAVAVDNGDRARQPFVEPEPNMLVPALAAPLPPAVIPAPAPPVQVIDPSGATTSVGVAVNVNVNGTSSQRVAVDVSVSVNSAMAAAAPAPRRKLLEGPAQDEWGFFDPDQCGFAALMARMDEVTTDENGTTRRTGTQVRVISYS